MAGVKFVVMYPRPQDIDTFEHLYQDEEVTIGDGLSSEYAGTFEAFEKLYQEEPVPMILDLASTVAPIWLRVRRRPRPYTWSFSTVRRAAAAFLSQRSVSTRPR